MMPNRISVRIAGLLAIGLAVWHPWAWQTQVLAQPEAQSPEAQSPDAQSPDDTARPEPSPHEPSPDGASRGGAPGSRASTERPDANRNANPNPAATSGAAVSDPHAAGAIDQDAGSLAPPVPPSAPDASSGVVPPGSGLEAVAPVSGPAAATEGSPGIASTAPTAPPGEGVAEPVSVGTGKRPVPDYDGRGEPPTSVGEAALWVPRVLLSPLYLVSEYVVRRPLGALVTAAEKGRWLAVLGDFFTFDEEQKVGIVPTAYLEFGFDPSVGLYFFADDAFADRNDLRVKGGMWPDDWWSLDVLDRWTNAADTLTISATASLLVRPDYVYHGIGPFTRARDLSRYAAQTHTAEAVVEYRPWRASYVRPRVGARHFVFDDHTGYQRDDDPSLRDAIADPNHALKELPPGFATGYTAAHVALDLALDTRRAFPAPGHGVRLETTGRYVADFETRSRWVRYGGALGGFVDLGDQRIVGLSGWVDFARAFRGTIPFTELPSLGGLEPMRGFRPGRLIGESRVGATLEYRWPVWVWLDMALHYDVGNVFGNNLEGFALRHFRNSFGIGLRSARTAEPDHAFSFQLGIGTETFDQGSRIDTVRVLFGGTRGF